jgi:hypothetical protein
MIRHILVFGTLVGTLVMGACAAGDDPAAAGDDPAATDEEDLAATVEQASSSDGGHHVEGTRPKLIDNGLTLTAKGSLSGLEKGKDVIVKLEAEAIAIATCSNPGGHEPPGQNPVERAITVSGYAVISGRDIKYGHAEYSVTTKAPDLVIAGAPDCPNSKWTEKIVDLKFTHAKLIFVQDGKICLTVVIVFKHPTYNGPVREEDSDCKFM